MTIMWAINMNNLRDLLAIMRTDRTPNARIRELCRGKVVVVGDEWINENVLR